jgi:eukaryotic-like serine/threonine-protein kinase
LEILIGTQLGLYEITAHVGKGGMGEVYRARDPKLKRDVAIKILPNEFGRDQDRIIRFQREAEVLASLNHSNIAAIYDLQEANEFRFLVLEFVEGETLADRVARGPLPVDDALNIARQICEALEAAHEKGIVHRDLKPANVKITPEGNVKVLDFGLAKAAEGKGGSDVSNSPTMTAAATQAGIILGTAGYMSPEQVRGKTVDRRADIWAFGCVLYEMLTGRRAFEGDEASDVLAAVIKSDPDWSALPPGTPPRLRALLQRCLQKIPRQRLRDIGDARIEIEEIQARPEGAITSRPAGARRRERLAWTAATAVLLLVIAGLVSMMYLRQPAADTTTYRFSVPLPDGVTFEGTTARISPDGTKLAFMARSRDGRRLVFVRALDALESVPLNGTDNANFPFWSPDSRTIGFFTDRQLKKIDIAGGPALTLCDVPMEADAGGTWNRKGEILFSNVRALYRISSAGGAPESLAIQSETGGNLIWPQFLPDDDHFLYVDQRSQDSAVYVGSLGSAERKLVAHASSNVAYANGFLFFTREDTLMAQRFDARRLETIGDAFPVAEHLQTGTGPPRGVFWVSERALAYRAGFGSAVSQLAWFDRDGKQTGVLGGTGTSQFNVELSPDGKRVAVSLGDATNRDLWLYDVERGIRTRFTFDAGQEDLPVWSPDGSRIVFRSRRKEHFDLYSKAANGAGAEELLLESSVDKVPNAWSEDNRFLVFDASSANNRSDLWALPLSGDRKPIPLLQTPFNEIKGQVSFDNRWIVYESNESGQPEIYVAPFPTFDGKWQISTTGGNQPRWRRDGKEIFYLGTDRRLMAASVNPQGKAFEVGPVRPLFQTNVRGGDPGHAYDVTADGQRFIINTLVEQATSTPITVVVNWAAELNKRLPR